MVGLYPETFYSIIWQSKIECFGYLNKIVWETLNCLSLPKCESLPKRIQKVQNLPRMFIWLMVLARSNGKKNGVTAKK